MLINPVAEIRQAIQLAAVKHDPREWFIAYSGGSDSAVVLQALLETGLCEQYDMKTMTIDTGIASKGHLWRVIQEVTRATGEPPMIYAGQGLDWYIKNSREQGFPYSFPFHTILYRSLKERAIEACTRDHKQHRLDRIAFVTGVRRSESTRRAKRPIIQRNGSRLTVNAIATLTERDKLPFLKRATWYEGKTTRDCMCNWHARFALEELKGSGAYEPICALSQEMKADGMWGYGEEPPEDWMLDDSTDDEMDADSLCVNCVRQMALL